MTLYTSPNNPGARKAGEEMMQHVKHMMLSEVRRPTMHRHDAPCPLLSPLMSVPLICIVSRLSSMCLRFAGSPPTPRPDHLLSRSLQEEPPILRNAVVVVFSLGDSAQLIVSGFLKVRRAVQKHL